MLNFLELLNVKDPQYTDKRRNKRYKVVFPVLFHSYPTGTIYTGETVDISEKGVGILSDSPFNGLEVNNGIYIKFFPERLKNFTIIGEIKHIKGNHLGVSFICIATNQEYLRMMQFAKVLGGDEKIKDIDSFIDMLDYLKE